MVWMRKWLISLVFWLWKQNETVKEKYRRQGIGEELLKAAIDKCRRRKIQRVSLHVDPERTAAMNLYKKLGFRVDALIEGYYSQNRNAYRMYIDFSQDSNSTN